MISEYRILYSRSNLQVSITAAELDRMYGSIPQCSVNGFTFVYQRMIRAGVMDIATLNQSGALSLVEVNQDTVLWLVEIMISLRPKDRAQDKKLGALSFVFLA